MVFKRFRLQITLRVILLLATLLLLSLLIGKDQFLVSLILLSILVVLQTISLIFYTERTNRRLTFGTPTFHLHFLKKAWEKVLKI